MIRVLLFAVAYQLRWWLAALAAGSVLWWAGCVVESSVDAIERERENRVNVIAIEALRGVQGR